MATSYWVTCYAHVEVSNAQQPYSIRVGRLGGRSCPDGTDPSVCANTSEIGVAENTAVTYCFEVTNTGLTPLSFHDLEDSELGEILDGFPFTLVPGASLFITQTAVITQTTVNTATWTAYNAGPINLTTATVTATVNVLEFLYLPIILKP